MSKNTGVRWLPAAGCGLILLLLPVLALSLWLAYRTASKVSAPEDGKAKPKAFVPPTPEQMRNQPAAETAVQMLRQRPDMSDPAVEAEVVRLMKESHDIRKKAAWEKAQQMGIPTQGTRPGGGTFELRDFKGDRPIYIGTENRNASMSSATDVVRKPADGDPVDGAGMAIGVWEMGLARTTHQEFKDANGGSRISVKDNAAGSAANHATHVVGTIAARGVKPEAQGMAPGIAVHFYNAAQDDAEMTQAGASGPDQAGKLLVANGSYGRSSMAWDYEENTLVWYGEFTDDDRPNNDLELAFGGYGAEAELLDFLAVDRPWFLLVQSAGNHRSLGPPDPGERWLCRKDHQIRVYDSAKHPRGNGMPGYMTIGEDKTAKNTLLVGGVSMALQGNERKIVQAQMTDFSCWGPVEDGRIKPDVVAQGKDVYSSQATADDAYGKTSGTSMASPVVAGSAILLQQLYKSKSDDGGAMRASTLKALIIHTADDLGSAGPDYQHGWGLMNTKAAADVIAAHAEGQDGGAIFEDKVTKAGATKTFTFAWDGTRPLRVTLCWADPAFERTAPKNPPRHLVNDLDLTVAAPDGTTIHRPYVMPFQETGAGHGSYGDAARLGVNRTDNVEQVYVAAPLPRGEYKISIAPTEITYGDDQDFSLIISGNDAPPAKPNGGPIVQIYQSDYGKYFSTRRNHFLQLAEPGDLRQLPEFKDKPEEFKKVYGLAFYRRFRSPQPDQDLRFRPGIAGGGIVPSSDVDAIYSSPATSQSVVQRVGFMFWVMPQAYMPPAMDGSGQWGLRPMDPSDPLAPRSYAYSIIYYHGPPNEEFKATPDQLREGPLSPWTRCEVAPRLLHFHDSLFEPVLDQQKRIPVARPENVQGFIQLKVAAFLRLNGRFQVPRYFVDWREMLPDYQPRYICRYTALDQERFSIVPGWHSDSSLMGDGFFDRRWLEPGTYPASVSFQIGNRGVQGHFDVNCTAQSEWNDVQERLKKQRADLDERIAIYTERARQHPSEPLIWDDLHLAGAYQGMSRAHLYCADFTNAEKYAKYGVEYWRRSVKLRPEDARYTQYLRHLADVYYAWDRPEEYLKTCDALLEPIKVAMSGPRANNELSSHWELVAREYFNMTGDVEAARRYMQKRVETWVGTPPPQIQVEWWEDPRTYRSPTDKPPARVTPRVLDPDPLVQRLPLR